MIASNVPANDRRLFLPDLMIDRLPICFLPAVN